MQDFSLDSSHNCLKLNIKISICTVTRAVRKVQRGQKCESKEASEEAQHYVNVPSLAVSSLITASLCFCWWSWPLLSIDFSSYFTTF